VITFAGISLGQQAIRPTANPTRRPAQTRHRPDRNYLPAQPPAPHNASGAGATATEKESKSTEYKLTWSDQQTDPTARSAGGSFPGAVSNSLMKEDALEKLWWLPEDQQPSKMLDAAQRILQLIPTIWRAPALLPT